MVLLLLAILSLSRVDKQFEIGNMLVLIATFLQAFLILHFVHWRWHRFGLSFDAVIKFFSSGFLLGISTAVVYEMVLSFLFSFAFYILIIFDIVAEGPTPDEDPKDFVVRYLHSHVWLFAIGVFFNAYVVAAVVEELVKYFSFWMCPHPDLISESEWKELGNSLEESNASANDTSTRNITQTLAEDANERALKSRGVAITISMVTAALGFACCENLEYVFTGKSGISLGMGEHSI